jgi:hypothetical protein
LQKTYKLIIKKIDKEIGETKWLAFQNKFKK